MIVTIEIQNLKCGGCAHTIISSLEGLSNVEDVHINVASSELTYNCLTAEDKQVVAQKLKNLGYPVIEDENSISLKAKSYISCAIGKIKK